MESVRQSTIEQKDISIKRKKLKWYKNKNKNKQIRQMTDYLNTMSFDALVIKTEPDSRFESVVLDFIRDKTYGYADSYGNNSWDSDLARTNDKIEQIKKENKTNLAILEKCKDQLERLRLDPKNKDYIKLKPEQKQSIQANYAMATDAIRDCNEELPTLLALQSKFMWNRTVEQMTSGNLKKLRMKFMCDNNINYLRRGITMALTYSYKMMDVELPGPVKPLTCGW